MKRLIIWGAGELGGRVAKTWDNGPVVALTRTTQRHAALQTSAGVTAQLGSAVGRLTTKDLLLLALPGHLKQKAALDALLQTPPPARAVLISSTGYYGQTASGRTDEDSPSGKTERAQRIAKTERLFLAWASGNGVVIRLGGLYRHGRGPLPALARRGEPLLRPPDKTLALIHYNDAATAVTAALKRPIVEAVYLAVTTPCPSRRTYYEAACQILGLSAPRFAEPIGLPAAQYDITRLQRDLLPQPAHPDWREALR